MFQPVIVDYPTAKVLAENHQDVIVFHGSTGNCCNFNNPQWPDPVSVATVEETECKHGIGGMDNEYVFIWLCIPPEEPK